MKYKTFFSGFVEFEAESREEAEKISREDLHVSGKRIKPTSSHFEVGNPICSGR